MLPDFTLTEWIIEAVALTISLGGLYFVVSGLLELLERQIKLFEEQNEI